MLTYSNDPAMKTAFVTEVQHHTDLDHLIKGAYGKSGPDWRGCAVGCAAVSWAAVKGIKICPDDHTALEREGLYPAWLAWLEDTIFEELPNDKAMGWPLRLSTAIPVGMDLEPVKWRFCAFLMQENIDRVLELDASADLKEQVVDVIRGVLLVTEQAITTGEWDASAAGSAWSARSANLSAWSARSASLSAESAAWSAECAAWSARSAAWSARSADLSAESATWSARSAAWAAQLAGRSAALSAAYERYADKLIELLAEA